MKRLLKRLFPIVFLKRAFLVFNKIKIITWDKLVYRTYKVAESEVILAESKNPFLAIQVDITSFPDKIQSGFSRWVNPEWTQDQYIVVIKNKRVSIDPETGWAIANGNQLIYFSLGFSKAPYVKKPGVASMLRKKNPVHLKKIISLRDTGEENYFHFYNDVMSKLWLLQHHGLINEDITIVISYKLWIKPYFRFIYENSIIKQWQWYVQREAWVTSDHAIFCKPFTHTKNYWLKTSAVVLPFLSKNPDRPKRLFLVRPETSLRFVENSGELEELLMAYQFQKIDTSVVPFPEQANLFFQAEVIIAVHGAGLANILFRNGQPLRVLELFHPNDYLPFHYIMLGKIFGYSYDALQGTVGERNGAGGFRVDIKDIENYCLSLSVGIR